MSFKVDKEEEKKPNTTLHKKYEKLNLKNIQMGLNEKNDKKYFNIEWHALDRRKKMYFSKFNIKN